MNHSSFCQVKSQTLLARNYKYIYITYIQQKYRRAQITAFCHSETA